MELDTLSRKSWKILLLGQLHLQWSLHFTAIRPTHRAQSSEEHFLVQFYSLISGARDWISASHKRNTCSITKLHLCVLVPPLLLNLRSQSEYQTWRKLLKWKMESKTNGRGELYGEKSSSYMEQRAWDNKKYSQINGLECAEEISQKAEQKDEHRKKMRKNILQI